MPMFRYVVKCNRNGQVLYVAQSDWLLFTPLKASAMQFTDRDKAMTLAKDIVANRKLGIRKAQAEKIGLSKEVPYVNR